ncbi:MAG: YihY/virulence factor BrkB family protein [Bacteroidota bacterium]|nr:YihY/virulence factor BrkB family protein [Bacteroidota bacterium]
MKQFISIIITFGHSQYIQLVAWIRFKLHEIRFTKHQLSLLEVVDEFFAELKNDEVISKAQSMAFNFLLALFPGMLFFLNLLPIIPIPNLTNEILLFLEQTLPGPIYVLFHDSIIDILKKPRTGLLSFGLFFALLASMNGVLSLMVAFNNCYNNAVEKRGFFQLRMVALLITLLLVAVLILAIVIMSVGESLIILVQQTPDMQPFIIQLIKSFRFIILTAVFFTAISIIYFIAPSIKVRWHFFSHGAIIASLLCVTVSVIFSYYIENFSSYNQLYGSIGTFLGLMLWFYLTSLVLLIGFEINASIDTIRNKGQLKHVRKIKFHMSKPQK